MRRYQALVAIGPRRHTWTVEADCLADAVVSAMRKTTENNPEGVAVDLLDIWRVR